MQVGWPGLSRAIALSIALTSACWIALGAWLFHAHVAADHLGGERRVAQGAAEAKPERGAGLLSGLIGTARQDSARQDRDHRDSGRQARAGVLMIPVAGVGPANLTDTFTQARAEGARHHHAIDIMANEGAPVLAAASGRVEKLFVSTDGGNTIYVRSPDRRLIYYYAHLSAYEAGLREGAAVRRGQRLGAVGHTGNANPDAPHLHFAVWGADPGKDWYQEGAVINPYPLLAGKRPH